MCSTTPAARPSIPSDRVTTRRSGTWWPPTIPDSQNWTDIGYAGLPLQMNEAGLDQLASTLNATNLTEEQVNRVIEGL